MRADYIKEKRIDQDRLKSAQQIFLPENLKSDKNDRNVQHERQRTDWQVRVMSHDKSDTGNSPGRERGVRRKIVDTDRKEKRTRYIKEQIDKETSKIISRHYSLQKT